MAGRTDEMAVDGLDRVVATGVTEQFRNLFLDQLLVWVDVPGNGLLTLAVHTFILPRQTRRLYD